MIARGIEDVASAADFTVIFCNTDESEEKEEKYIRILAQKQIDGVLLIPACGNPDSVEFLQSKDIPVVLLDRRVPDVQADLVRCDSKDGAYQLINRLIELGHKHIAVITGPEGVSTSDDRVAGYQQALSKAGLTDNEHIYYGYFYTSQRICACYPGAIEDPIPTALFGANNFISIGILKALRDADVQVPQDISVVGFDDLPTIHGSRSRSDCPAQPAYEMGRQAAALIIISSCGRSADNHQEIILPTEIIERQSSSTPRSKP